MFFLGSLTHVTSDEQVVRGTLKIYKLSEESGCAS
jgi:hypothetical protein